MQSRVRLPGEDDPPITAVYEPNSHGFIPPGNCVECLVPIPSNKQPFAILKPCNHIICTSCLAKALAIKAPTKEVVCVSCKKAVESHIPYKLSVIKTGGDADGDGNATKLVFVEEAEVNHAAPIARDVYSNPSRDKDPVRYWMKHSSENDRINKGLMYFVDSTRNNDGELVLRDPITCYFDLQARCCNSAADEDNLDEMFRRLNTIVTIPSAEVQDGNFSGLLETIESAVADGDILVRLLFSLGGGTRMTPTIHKLITNPGSDKSRYIRSDWLAAWAAKQLLIQFQANQKGGNRVVGTLQRLIGDMVYSLGAEKKTIQLLSEFRLSASLSYLDNKSKEAVRTRLKGKYDVDPLGFLSSCIDNFELVIKKGTKSGMEHWVFQAMLRLSYDHLKKLGFYAENEEDRISREGTTLEELKEQYKSAGLDWIDEIWGVRPQDLEDFSFYVLRYIECAIELPLPDNFDCDEMKASQMFSSCSTRVPRNLGIDVHPREFDPKQREHRFKPRKYDPNATPADYYCYKVEGMDPSEIAEHTFLSLNNMFMDVPLKENLNRKEVVVLYLESYVQLLKDQLDGVVVSDGHERPVAEIMHSHVCDGHPTAQILALFDKCALNNDPTFSKIRVFCGGFHTKKDAIHAKHKLSEVQTRYTIKDYRTGPNTQQKFLFPGDPNEFEEEEVQRLMSILREAVDQCAEAKGSSSVSAKEVHQHMLKCAAAHPDSNALLLDVYNTVIYLMMRDSAKCNSSELYFTAMRLLLPLFITTNCSTYVRICFEQLLWRATAPTAEIVLFRETAFTRETPGKKHIFADEGHEQINFYARNDVGDCVRVGTDAKVEETVLNMHDNLKRKQGIQAMKGLEVHRSSVPFNESTVCVNQVYVTSRLNVHRLRVWDLSRPAGDNVLRDPSNGELTPTESLQYRSIGTGRVREYGTLFYHLKRFSVKRPTSFKRGGVPVGRLRSLPSELRINETTRRALMTSLSPEDLKKASKGKKEGLIIELIDVSKKLETLPPLITFTQRGLKKLKVDDLIELLVDCRKQHIQELQQGQQDVSVAFEFLDGEDRSAMDAYSDPDLRKQELDLSFYQLSDFQRNMFSNPIEVASYDNE